MSASNKFGMFSDEQLMDWMRCNPGGAAKAFEYWRISNPNGVRVEREEVIVEKVVPVQSSLSPVLIGVSVGTFILSVVFGGMIARSGPSVVKVPGPVREVPERNPTYGGRLVSSIVEENKSLIRRNRALEHKNETQAESIRELRNSK